MRRNLLWAAALVSGLTLMSCEDHQPPPPLPEGQTVTESALQDQLRQLWAERVFYSRALMISTLHELDDRQVMSERLRRNNDELAAAFDSFYASVGAGSQISTYLDTDQDHLEAALNTVAQGGDLGHLKGAWKDNIKAMADYLESLNSELPGSVDGHLNDYVDHSFNQIEQRRVFDWLDDVNAFDKSVDNANKLADRLTEGFLKQYPNNVTEESNEKYQELRTDQRKLWMDHFMWHHLFNLSGLHELPDIAASRQRAILNQSDLGGSLKPLYGPVAAEQFAAMLREHVLNAEQLVNYTKVNDQSSMVTTKVIGLANADQIAKFLSSLNPNLPLEVTQPSTKRHLELVYEDIDAIFDADAVRELRTLEELEVHSMQTADEFSAATQAMFPNQVNQ